QRTDRRGPCDRDPLPAQRPRDRRPDLRADARPARADRRGAGRRRRARGAERPPADARGDLPVAYGKRARVRLFLHQLRGEQRLYWRSRELAFFTFIFPLLIFVLLGSVYGHDKIKSEGNVKGSSYLLAGVLGYGVAATALGGLAIWLVIRREDGILKRVRGTPLPPATYLAAVLVSILIVYALEAIALILLARVLFHVGLPHRVFSLALAIVLGTLAFAAMALALSGLIRSAEGSSAVVNAVYLPMAFISGSFWSVHSYPRALRAIADVLPLTYFIRLMRDIVLRNVEIWSRPEAVAIVAAWGAGGLVVALRRFRWEPREG